MRQPPPTSLARHRRPPHPAAARAAVADPSARVLPEPSHRFLLLFLAAHVPLTFALRLHPLVPTVHALATVAMGLAWVGRSPRLDRVVAVAAYVVGSELLWRGHGARIFYESGKYAVAALLILALVRTGRLGRASPLPAVYFGLLLPSLAVLPYFDRQEVAFNLSGPFALAAAGLFFSATRLTREHLQWIFLGILGPAVGLASVATQSVMQIDEFSVVVSSRSTAGGIGPNQVASILGLGALVAFLYTLTIPRSKKMVILLGTVSLWLAAQSVLTFSRGGFWTLLGALGAGVFFLLRDRQFRAAVAVRGAILGLVAASFLYPVLDDFTGGSLSARFSDFEASGRTEIVQADIEAFQENPVFGLGPGQSTYYHAMVFRRAIAHTEYSRLLAEHGSFGLAAFLLLGVLALRNLAGAPTTAARGLAAAAMVWAFLYMLHSAMRMVAPAFVFALACGRLPAVLTGSATPTPVRRAPRPPQISSPHVRHRRPRLS